MAIVRDRLYVASMHKAAMLGCEVVQRLADLQTVLLEEMAAASCTACACAAALVQRATDCLLILVSLMQ